MPRRARRDMHNFVVRDMPRKALRDIERFAFVLFLLRKRDMRLRRMICRFVRERSYFTLGEAEHITTPKVSISRRRRRHITLAKQAYHDAKRPYHSALADKKENLWQKHHTSFP